MIVGAFIVISLIYTVFYLWALLKPKKKDPIEIDIDVIHQEVRLILLDLKMAEFHKGIIGLDELAAFDEGNKVHDWAIDQGFSNAEIMDSSDRILEEMKVK